MRTLLFLTLVALACSLAFAVNKEEKVDEAVALQVDKTEQQATDSQTPHKHKVTFISGNDNTVFVRSPKNDLDEMQNVREQGVKRDMKADRDDQQEQDNKHKDFISQEASAKLRKQKDLSTNQLAYSLQLKQQHQLWESKAVAADKKLTQQQEQETKADIQKTNDAIAKIRADEAESKNGAKKDEQNAKDEATKKTNEKLEQEKKKLDEQTTKAREADEKANEATTKKSQEQQKKLDDAKQREAEEDEKRVKEASSKKEQQEKQNEQNTKKAQQAEQESKNRMEQENKQNAAEADTKAKAEQQQKEQAQKEAQQKEQAQKESQQKEQNQKAQERQQKEQAQKESQQKEQAQKEQGQKEQSQKEQAGKERNQKEQAQKEQGQKEQAQKEQAGKEQNAKRNANGRWCNCRTVGINWGPRRENKNCPDGFLITGMYRGGSEALPSIDQYKCCQPCRDDGRTALRVINCNNANWWGSFDREGWSECPGNTFIQGFWMNDCNYIYCLEEARCCQIEGSRGRRSCSDKNWWSSFDRAGWSELDGDQFMIGLYRTGGQNVYNIEMPKQCVYWAY